MQLCLLLLATLLPQDALVETRRMLPPLDKGPDNFRAAAAADVTGDGWTDVLIGTEGSDFLLVNAGGGRFEDGSDTLPLLSDDTYAVELADFDGDGDPDAFLGNRNDPSRLYRNAAGTLVLAQDVSGAAALVSASVVGDIDLDGDLDLVLAADGGVDQVFRNGGSGLALALDPAALPPAVDFSRDLSLGDIDSDGDPDLAVVAYDFGLAASPNRLFRNDGSGVFLQLPGSDLGVDGRGVSLADLDGDGDVDAYVSSDPDFFAFGDGTGSFFAASSPATLATGGSVVLDLAGDGPVDVLPFALYLSAGVHVLTGLGGGGFAETTSSALPGQGAASDLVAADFDGDLDADLLVLGLNQQPRLWLNDGGVLGEFQATVPYDLNNITSVAVGDVDGDGSKDALLGVSPGANRLLLNDGSGQWSEATEQLDPTDLQTLAVALADLDADGDLDALAGGSDGPAELLLNDGAGVFTELVGAFPGTADNASGFAIGDVDGDGDPDVANARLKVLLASASVFVNDGAGFFSLSATLQGLPSSNFVRTPRFLDADGDGDLDVLAAGYEEILYRLGDGAGGFTAAPAAYVPFLAARELDVGDVDLDGDTDTVVAMDGVDQLLLNDGTGVLTSGAGYPALDVPTYDLALVDFDGDGDLDLMTAGEENGLHANDGAGAFNLVSTFGGYGSGAAFGPVFADLDADGDLDLLCVDNVQATQYTQVVGGQTAWGSVPRAGKALRMEVFGGPGAPWTLVASPGTASLALPPLGTLLVDPGVLWLIASGAMPAEGVAAVDVPVAQDAALVGQTVYWQSLVGASPTLTNREATAVTGY
ncbi:MAG: VCBS repeat-containing protein [Planctomycetota bacterium]